MLLAIAACAKTPSESAPETTAPLQDTGADTGSNDTEQPEEKLFLVADGAPQYSISYTDTEYTDIADGLKASLTQKTGVDFKISRFGITETEHLIYIGEDYAALSPDGKGLTLEAYTIFMKDGDIYICGGSISAIGKAAQYFSACIVPKEHVEADANGKTVSVILPQNALSSNTPKYFYEDPTLLSAHISEYSIVIPASSNPAEEELAHVLSNVIAEYAGWTVDIRFDSSSPTEHEIVIGNTKHTQNDSLFEGLETDEYVIKSIDNDVYVAYGSFLAYSDAINTLAALCDDKEEESIDISKKVSNNYMLSKPEGSDLRIMTSNTLLGISSPMPPLSHEARMYVNAECYLTYLPDVVGLQEVDSTNKNHLKKALAGVYEFVDSNPTKPEYTPIIYLKDKYKVEEARQVPLYVDAHGGWRSYVMARFSLISDPDTQFIVVNLHYSPHAEQLEKDPGPLNAELKYLQQTYPDLPIFMTGDYNSYLGSETLKRTFEGLEKEMVSSLTVAQSRTEGSAGIDHVFVIKDKVTVEQYAYLNYQIICYGSDHVPVFVDVSVKP